MSLLAFDLRFPDDDTCWTHLEALRWPDGVVCPKCRSVGDAAPWKPRPHRWQCPHCGKQFHAAQGTPIKGSHLPLITWFRAIYLLAIAPRLSSIQLARHLEIGQKTAWSVGRRVRQMAAEQESIVRSVVGAVEGTAHKPRRKR